jgi:hypothetical protein
MHRRILGFSCALAVLFVGYAIGWLIDRHGISSITSRPDSFVFALQVLTLALIFKLSVLFIVVWPQTMLANWIVRRFRVRRFFLLAFFFGVSSIAACLLIFLNNHDDWFLKYLLLVAYLLAPCSILWRISFRYEPVA